MTLMKRTPCTDHIAHPFLNASFLKLHLPHSQSRNSCLHAASVHDVCYIWQHMRGRDRLSDVVLHSLSMAFVLTGSRRGFLLSRTTNLRGLGKQGAENPVHGIVKPIGYVEILSVVFPSNVLFS